MESLGVKYRPHRFEDVVSQESIVKILKKQIEMKQFGNTYLFCGTSGCGKTTCARIFANEINHYQGSPIEIDAASNNGVDNVKQIVNAAQQRALDSEYKIYIIDECHSLSNSAWQAFLKCIEEPPKYTIFIFCTTEKNKVPDTIKNRCQVFNFNRIPQNKINDRLQFICKQEGFTNYEDACNYISRICNGEMRNGISILEKCSGYDTNLDLENTVLKALGDYSYQTYFDLINSIIDNDQKNVIGIVNYLYGQGNDMKQFVDSFLSFILDISKYIIFESIQVTSIPNNMEDNIKNSINFDNSGKYYSYVTDRLLDLKNMLKNDIRPKDTILVYFLKISRCE